MQRDIFTITREIINNDIKVNVYNNTKIINMENNTIGIEIYEETVTDEGFILYIDIDKTIVKQYKEGGYDIEQNEYHLIPMNILNSYKNKDLSIYNKNYYKYHEDISKYINKCNNIVEYTTLFPPIKDNYAYSTTITKTKYFYEKGVKKSASIVEENGKIINIYNNGKCVWSE